MPLVTESVRRADDSLAAAHFEDVGIVHRRLDILVPEELLDGADVVAGHEEVGSKRVTQCVAAGSFRDARISDCLFDGLLNN